VPDGVLAEHPEATPRVRTMHEARTARTASLGAAAAV
jgi:hypothetical protein